MNINKTFDSKWLSAADLDEEDQIVTITGLQVEEVGRNKESKPVLFFKEYDKGMVLNKTNANTIAAMYGSETDEWIDKRLTLFETTVDFEGKSTQAIRIKGRPPKATAPARPSPTPPAATGRPGTGAPATARRAALQQQPAQVDDDEWDEANPVF